MLLLRQEPLASRLWDDVKCVQTETIMEFEPNDEQPLRVTLRRLPSG